MVQIFACVPQSNSVPSVQMQCRMIDLGLLQADAFDEPLPPILKRRVAFRAMNEHACSLKQICAQQPIAPP